MRRPLRPIRSIRPAFSLGPGIQPSKFKEQQATDQAVEVLAAGDLFRRGRVLVQVSAGDHGEPYIRYAPLSGNRIALGSVAMWVVYDSERRKEKPIPVPKWLVEDVMGAGDWPHVRYLKRG